MTATANSITTGSRLNLNIQPGTPVRVEVNGDYREAEIIEVAQTGAFVDMGGEIIGVPWPSVAPLINFGEFEVIPAAADTPAAIKVA